MQRHSRIFPSVSVSFTGQSMISHAGVSVLTGFMDALGFGRLCEERLGQFVPSGARHRPGGLVGSLAAMLAVGGEHASDLDLLRSSPGLFGQLPLNATVSRFFEPTVTNPELFGYGFAPFIAFCDYGAGEILACVLRPGNAGANSAEDHIRVFHTVTAQLPECFFDETGALAGEKVLVRTDSAGASRKFLWHLHSLGVQFSTSYTLPFGKAHMIDWISDKQYWQPALDQTGPDRTGAWVINATDVIPLTDYPPGTNLFLRAGPLHPGAQPTLLDTGGHRITAMPTNSPRWHGPFPDARHRGRCENRIKTLKNTGLGKPPFFDFAANQAWANIAALALNLVSWIQLEVLPDGHHAKARDIKRWRYRLFATAGKIITRARRHQLLLPDSAPEKDLLKLLLAITGYLKQLLSPG